MADIHYIQPYRADKNIGAAINLAIRQLNPLPNDWIVHVDQDVCFLRPDSKKQIAEVLEYTDYDVLGCLTNRLSYNHQLYLNRLNESGDMREHISIAAVCHEKYYGQVIPTNVNLAAFMMCFRVSTWEKVGGFAENNIQFDMRFTDEVKHMGGKLGIMTGVYCFHLYRMWAKRPVGEISHLLRESVNQIA